VPIGVDILQETIQKYVCLKFLIQIKEVNTSEVHTNVLLNNGIKISMDGKGRAIDNILLKDYGGQSNTRMYIYKHILTESAFTEDLKIILNFIIHGDISH
jgi:hypothetical protein